MAEKTLIPPRFLIRIKHVCLYHKDMPKKSKRSGLMLNLPPEATLRHTSFEDQRTLTQISLAWNEFGLGVSCQLPVKKKKFQVNTGKPYESDGLSLWLDTRDVRTAHRASRYCHQFHLFPIGNHHEHEEDGPILIQSKINRATQDAPVFSSEQFQTSMTYGRQNIILEAFIPGNCLQGFDPEQHRTWGFYYYWRDQELGEQYLSVGREFPFHDDPSLWEPLELQAKERRPET